MLFEGVDLNGRTLLDIGCWDGAYSVEATHRGATVTAADHHVWHDSWGDRRCIDLVRRHLAPSMTIVDADLPELTPERLGRFDIVLFLGVLYHLRHPLAALEHVAQLVTDTLIIETRMTMRHVGKPVMQFHPGKTLGNDPTNWWTPNRRCVEEMLRDLGFRQIRYTQSDWLWRRGTSTPAEIADLDTRLAVSAFARISTQLRRADAGDGCGLVVVRIVAGDANCTDDGAVCATDKHAAWHRHQRTTDRVGHGGDEMRIRRRPLHQSAGAETERQRTMRLAAGDLEAAQTCAVLRGEGFRRTTPVQHHDGEWLRPLRSVPCLSAVVMMVCAWASVSWGMAGILLA